MELYGRQQQLYFINQELADRVKDLVATTLGAGLQAEAVLALASHALSLADHLMAYFEANHQLPHAIACREGCNFCCYNQVEVTPPEALLIGHYVAENFSPAERDGLRNRVMGALSLKAGKSKKKIARLRHKLPCALLQDGKCTVYTVRPLVCRAMHAFSAGTCEAELVQGKLGPGEFYAHRYEFVWSISSGLQTGCREFGCQSGVIDLDVALDDFFGAASPMEQWIQGGQIFRI
jgi:Fe-S-cluster containining protein